MTQGKLFIFSAPSGSGKSTIINALIGDPTLRLQFSVSATTRPMREGETHGVDYYFMSVDDFKQAIADDRFAECEEVYEGRFYGTLKTEISRITDAGNNVVLDVDVKGGCRVKELYGDDALAIFIMPPSVEVLRERLIKRGTDSIEDINNRVAKAAYEITFAEKYDRVVVNDNLETAIDQTRDIIKQFIEA